MPKRSFSATMDNSLTNMIAATWGHKLLNRKTRKTGILDLGATSGAGPEEDEEYLLDTGLKFKKPSCSQIGAQSKPPRRCY
jgi:hypothetical protein